MGHRVRGSASFLNFFFSVLSFSASILLFSASPALAQTTQVTGQVLDTNGLPYAGASMKAGLVFAGTPVSNPTVTISTLSQCKANGFGSAPCQVPFAPTNGPFTLDLQGNIPGGGITLQDNTQVTPGGTQWAFTVSTAGSPPPLGTGPQTCAATLTISGASQSISPSFGGCPALSSGSGIASPPTILDPATPSVGGQTQVVQTSFNEANSVNPLAITFLYPTSQGHTYLIIARWTNGGPALSSFTTTQGDTCTQIGTTQSNGEQVAAGICSGVTGGASTVINVNFASAPAFTGAAAFELTPGTVDAFVTNSGNSTSASTGNLTTTAFAQETLFILAGLASGVTPAPAIPYNGVVPPGSSTNIPLGFNTIQGFSGGGWVGFAEAGVTTAIGTYNVTATSISPSQQWVSFFVAMKGTPSTPISFTGNVKAPVNLGTITGPLTPVQFQISNGQASYPSGQLNISVVSGSIIDGGFALTASLDGGNTWFGVPADVVRTTTITGSDPTVLFSAQYSVVGLAGAILRFGPYQGYGISNLVVWASVG